MKHLKLAKAFVQSQGGITGDPQTIIMKQAARVLKLEVFVQKFLDNFDECKICNGKGVVTRDDFECGHCHGTGKRIASIGVLYVELIDEADALLKVKS